MMKFVVNHEENFRALNAWATGMTVVSPKFYFWGLGRGMQKSQAGLLRSLLLQILITDLNVTKAAMPDIWNQLASQRNCLIEKLKGSWYSWSVPELKDALEKAIDQTHSGIKFRFFIDGLDEFDGDHHELISFCQSLSRRPSVKLCLASRPLLVFEEAFKSCPGLRLQDLTRGDITKYSSEKLQSHPRSLSISREKPGLMDGLLVDIVQMSSGVFLWVMLAVKSLLDGMTNSDDICDLRRRLHELPPELHDLYAHLLDQIHPKFYLEQASRLLQIQYQSEEEISSAFLSFADERDHNLVFNIGKVVLIDVKEREKALSSRLKSRCLGLLETGGGLPR